MDQLVVLVVEDDETTRRALVRMLGKDPRVQALAAEDGLEALRVLESQPVDVVISDEVMPRVNGLRLLEAIRTRWPGTRRVLYTGHIDAEVVMNAINRGGVDKALSKGMLPEQFRAEVEELIDDCLAKRVGPSAEGRREEAPSVVHEHPSTVLVVCDELAVRRAVEDSLRADQLAVHGVPTTQLEAGMKQGAHVVVLDLSGPTGDAVASMRCIREQDLDCPVIVLVSRSGVAQAHEAVRLGAHRYLVHPVARDSLAQVVRRAATMARLARARRDVVAATAGGPGGVGDRAGLEVRFQRAIDRLFLVYQPIVQWSNKRIVGFEALVRSEEPTLPHPGLLLDAAARLDRMPVLSAAIRQIAHRPFLERRDDVKLFLNLHVSDVTSADLLDSELSEMASRVVLEITERASLESVEGLDGHVSALRARGYAIAIDDLGSGYAGLSSFAMLDPDLVKLDMSLVRNVHESPVKRRLVQSLQEACRDLGVPMVAEGVETAEERDALIAAGCDHFQGFLFARPARELPSVRW
ncbi:MAG: EAL domain-containing protein [Sandaracinaceae bacterium]|nr:EAL domain-containing protein [Sandaracinaceae bacterium]